MASSPKAIPVRVRNTTLRDMVLRVDPEFNYTSQNQVEYEFSNKGGARRKFTGRTSQRGPYAEE